MRQSSVAHASGSCITIAGGSQVPHFHQKRGNLRVRHFGTPPQQGLVPPDLVVLLGKCPGSRSSHSADDTRRGHCMCESAGNRSFRMFDEPWCKEVNMGKVKIIGHSLFCTCFYAHGKVLQAVPGRGSHPGLFSMGLAIMRRDCRDAGLRFMALILIFMLSASYGFSCSWWMSRVV